MVLAASLSNISLDFIEGVKSDDVESLPSHSEHLGLPISSISTGAVGSWRAHMNAMRAVVKNDYATALILEDDVDCDVRLKDQLFQFTKAVRAFTMPRTRISLASNPRASKMARRGKTLADEYVPDGDDSELDPLSTSYVDKHTLSMNDVLNAVINRHANSPYGEAWDVLWLGHCGSEYPVPSSRPSTTPVSLLRVAVASDPTVPAPQHLRPHPFALLDDLATQYPPHTRTVHAVSDTACTFAYAVSHRGAQKLLYRFGLKEFTGQWDIMLSEWCGGKTYDGTKDRGSNGSHSADNLRNKAELGSSEQQGRPRRSRNPVCVTVQPPLISHFYAEGGGSDIQGEGGGSLTEKLVGSPYVRLSVMGNLNQLTDGADMDELWDQVPNDATESWR